MQISDQHDREDDQHGGLDALAKSKANPVHGLGWNEAAKLQLSTVHSASFFSSSISSLLIFWPGFMLQVV